jgi:chromosome segregation ATPase
VLNGWCTSPFQERAAHEREAVSLALANSKLMQEVLDWRKNYSVLSLRCASAEEDAELAKGNAAALQAQLTVAAQERAIAESRMADLAAKMHRLQADQRVAQESTQVQTLCMLFFASRGGLK